MLSHKDYAAIGKRCGIFSVAEMDDRYCARKQIVTPSQKATNAYSVAKTFTVTAVGLCVDRGLLHEEDKFLDVMGIDAQGLDEKWRHVTVSALLSHRWGTDIPELLDINVDDVASYQTKDFLQYVLQKPLNGEVGGSYCYTDAAYYLLSCLVEKVSGVTLSEWMRPVLMGKMGFVEYAWASCPLGHTMGGTGLFLRSEDAVKLGALYLNDGIWQGERILSQEWCDTVKAKEYGFSRRANGWWGKGGMHGQFLAFHPEKKLAVAWLGYGSGRPDEILP